jgi:hypothetical protein
LRTPIVIAAVVGLIGIAALAVRAVAANVSGCSGGIRLTVAAAPEVEPAVREAAERWVQSTPRVNGQCVGVQVRAAEPADVANLLAVRAGGSINVAADPVPTPSDADVPAAWIPDSSSWIVRMQTVNREAFDPDTPSIALSPVVFAMPEAVAAATKRPVGRAELLGLMQKVGAGTLKVAAVEPRRNSASLVGAALLRDAIVTDPKKLVDMVRAYRAVNVAPDTGTLLKSFAANQVAPMSEQAVLAFDNADPAPAIPLAAVPVEPAIALDYPYAIVNGKPRAVMEAAEQFRNALAGATNLDVFAKRGFRAPDGTTGAGFPAGHGASAGQLLAQPFADPAKVADVLSNWTATKSPSRVLTLVDVTASMNKPIVVKGGAASRLDVLRKTAVDGLRLFTDDSQLGLWAFADSHREVVPVGELGAAQRGRLTTAVNAATASPSDVCGLYEAVLAAYKSLKDGYQEGRSNTVVVFTDGANSKAGMTMEQLELELERATDPTRPVRVVLLGIGPEVDQAELDEIAQRTGGKAFSVQDPEQIGTIFLEALLRTNS